MIGDADVHFAGTLHQREVLGEIRADLTNKLLHRLQPALLHFGRLGPMLI